MAACCKHFQSLLNKTNRIISWWTEQRRAQSKYNPHFKRPVVEPEGIQATIKETPQDDLLATRFRPAENNQSCSVFYHEDVAKFTNYVMRRGMKTVAREEVEKAFTNIKHIQLRKFNRETDAEARREILLNPYEIFKLAVSNCTPKLNVSKLKKSGTWYKIPVGVKPQTARFLAMRWIIQAAKDKEKKARFYKELANELINASQSTGKAYNKKLELHKLCEANRSYAHFKWT